MTTYRDIVLLDSPVNGPYQFESGVEFRLETGLPTLSSATEMKILVTKPSGITDIWIASRYPDSSQIVYVTLDGDLDESGTYTLQSSVAWGSDILLGDIITVTITSLDDDSRINMSKLIRYFSVYYRNITIQTLSENNEIPEEGYDNELLYDAFELYTEQATDELSNILDSRNIVLTDTQKYVAICHLIADYYEMGETDWSHRSQSMGSGVSFSRGEDTGARLALNKLLDQVQAAANATRRPGVHMGASNIKHVKDSTHYPRRFKKTALPSWNFSEDGFDSEEVPDVGGNYTDRTY